MISRYKQFVIRVFCGTEYAHSSIEAILNQ